MSDSKSSVSIRPAVSEDLEQILAIEKVSYPEPWSQDHFIEEFRKPYSQLLVLSDDETDTIVVGYVVYWIQAEGVSLLNICIHPKWRGLGFSKKLMHAMINETVREEIPKIILEVRESNLEAIALYTKIGFKTIHERAGFYQNGETALVMEIKTSDIQTMVQ